MRARLVPCLALTFLSACGESEAEKMVKIGLNDPAATQFQNVQICPNDKSVTTGEFNAKNLYGGYIGFKPFYYAGNGKIVMLDSDEFSRFTTKCYGEIKVDPADKVAVEAKKALDELDRAHAALKKASR